MRYLTLFSWEWLAYLFGYSSIIIVGTWMLWSQKKLHKKQDLQLLNQTLPQSLSGSQSIQMEPMGKSTVWMGRVLCLILGLGVGVLGTLTVDYWTTYPPLENVLVIAEHSDGSYRMVDGSGREFETKFCHGKDDLVPGNKLREISYRQEVGCKNVRGASLGYSVYTDSEGKRLLFPIPKEYASER